MMILRKVSRWVGLTLEYEPSWFAESGSALGTLLWAIFAVLTDDFNVRGWAWILPIGGVLLGTGRAVMLLQLKPIMRVLGAFLGAVWWGWLFITLWQAIGPIPSHAGYAVGLYCDLLTLLKFSLVAWRRPNAHDC